jgi:hypothetical protein
MMVGTAVELAQTKNIVLIVSAIQDHQWVEIVSTKCNYVHFFRCLQNMECWKHSFWITMTLFLHPAFCTPYLGYNFFSGSQYDPCFQNKNSGCRLTGQTCTNVMPNSKSRLPMPDNCYQLEKWCIISFTEAGHLSKSRKSQWKNKLDFIKVRFIYTVNDYRTIIGQSSEDPL